MLRTEVQSNETVKAVLKVSMIVNKKARERGEVVDLTRREFKYFAYHDRVLEATPENVALVKEQVAAEEKAAKEAMKRAAVADDKIAAQEARIAQLEALVAELAKKK